jgi:hypothetical protein
MVHRYFALSILLFSSPALARDWNQIYEAEGVTVSRAEVEDSKLFAFKGDTVFDAEVGRVLGVLMDNDHRTQWVDRLATNYILERTNEWDYVLYQAFELPALFSDRDYVYRGQVTREPVTGVVTLAMQSIDHPKAPETVGVRAELINSRYVLTPVGEGKTRCEVEIITDPMGWMPAWLVNIIQKDWPVTTLNGLRGQLHKPFTEVYPLPGVAEEADTDVDPDVDPPMDDETAAPAEMAPPAEVPATEPAPAVDEVPAAAP